MAEPTTASGAKPLTAAEREQLNELTARNAAAEVAANEEAKAARLANLGTVIALISKLRTPSMKTALSDAFNDPLLDFDAKQKISNFQTSIDYNIGTLEKLIAELQPSAPAPKP